MPAEGHGGALAGADAVLPVGDVQYEDATYPTFLQSYDPSWGAYKAITYPVPGGPARYSLELVGVDGRRRSLGPVVVPG